MTDKTTTPNKSKPMEINHKIEFVDGPFNTDTGKLVCVQSQKHVDVQLCFAAGMNVPFADIKLYTRDRYVDAKAVFPDAVALGEEIVKRWNRGPVPDFSEAGFIPMPKALTAENGAKYCLLGEFNEEIELLHPHYDPADTSENAVPETYMQKVPVSWTTIKAIYALAVEHFTGKLKH